MIQGIFKILIWILIAGWFVVIIGFVSNEADKVLCNRIEVVLSDTVQNRFVTKSDIRSMLESTDLHLQGYSMAEINIRTLERELEQNPYIRNAEVSKDISGKLEVKVEQRRPLIRIMPKGKRGFYLDTEGIILPLSERFTPLIMLATGQIPEPGSTGETGKTLEEIFRFSSFLADHEFWDDQVVQIYVNRNGEYELIPRVGAHHIILGNMDQWQKKLRNLELLYRQGFSRYGWNTYGTINLKYTNQVICTKR
ncbi:MAG: FtsQ-type POTRA domain-containing protein [Bacteroidales bacterium]|nr:FtsQ-type POTRA domain-containing protein [Bacteroidales bacterium]